LARRSCPDPIAHHAPEPPYQYQRHADRTDQTRLGQQIEYCVMRMQRHLGRFANLGHLLELGPAELAIANPKQWMRAEHRPGMCPQGAAGGNLITGLELRDGVEQPPVEQLTSVLDGWLE